MPGKTSKPPTKSASKPAAKKVAKKIAKKAGKKVAKKTAATTPKPRKPAAKPQAGNTATPRLLSGGNPQIPKAYGDAPVQAYIAAMPGWKSAIGRQIDSLVERAVPEVYKAVKWNSPLYGIEGEGWFLSMHTFNHYVKVAFFRGASLDPMPPGESRTPHTRYLNVREDEPIDQAQFIAWVKQARRLPGEKM